jgi:hypothetical protein
MMPRALCFLALGLLVPFAAAKDKPSIPKLIVNARYVMVTTYFGDELASPRVPPADRQAVTDVQDAIQDWGRYTLVYERKNADLILLVRKGRVAEAQGGIDIHAGSNQPRPSLGTITDADAGDPQDMLAIYNAAQGVDSAPMWRDRMTDGLSGPRVRLLEELRTKVEAAAKSQ